MKNRPEDLCRELALRGVNGGDDLVETHGVRVVAATLAHVDERARKGEEIGPGLIVTILRDGGPPQPKVKETNREYFDRMVEEWGRKLPGEYPPFAAMAASAIGAGATKEQVLDRLRTSGRDARTLRAG